MQLNIKDEKAYRLARELSLLTGDTMTGVVIEALEQHLKREGERRRPGWVRDRLMEIGRECAALEDRDLRSADEIVGYDEYGAPV